jgi:hypothetical protein
MRTRLACAALAMIAGAACTETDSATDLNPEGPPMIRQVRLRERILDSQGTERTPIVFAFGTHELAFPEEVHPVQTAVAVGNRLRVIMDELLVGNHLEEIGCRDGSFSRIPLGASGRYSVCICRDPAGCTLLPLSQVGPICPTNANPLTVPMGSPIGTLDCNQDGAADRMRLIDGAVGIQCGSISVPINTTASYWNPSGTQNKPAQGGFEALGPAIVLSPAGPLPTNIGCTLRFSPDVVDKQGIGVCAPRDGDIRAGCTPGDVSAFTFGIEALTVKPPLPATNVPRMQPVAFAINAPLDPNTLAGIEINPVPPGAVTITTPMNAAILIAVAGGWAAQTQYTVTFPVTITDTFARPLPEVKTYQFTTGT